MDAQEEERHAAENILRAFRNYDKEGLLDVLRWEHNYNKLSSTHQRLMRSLQEVHGKARECLKRNQDFFDKLVAAVDEDNENESSPLRESQETSTSGRRGSNDLSSRKEKEGERVSALDVEKVRYVLKDLVREWSAEGAIERAQSYDKITGILCELFPVRGPGHRPKVLVPGCGLGRLVLEIASRGFVVEGNEFSYYMLFTSAFVMNYAERKDQWEIFPYLLNSCNNRTHGDQLRRVRIPDVCANDFASTIVDPNQMSICGGDFVEVYGREEHKGKWDSVVTCFFLDTAHNFIDYVEVIRHCLKDGGVWINLGPLLWHWADHTYLGPNELSLEVPWEDVERVIEEEYGFQRERQEMAKCNYTNNMKSMMQTVFFCNLSVYKKAS